MSSTNAAHPHALIGVAHAPAGMLLPATHAVEAPRSDHSTLRIWLDVLGGVCFAIFVSVFLMQYVWAGMFMGRGFAPVIGWESVWLVAAMICSLLLPSGIRHDISWRSTLRGLVLDWPELLYGTWILGMYAAYIGGIRLEAGPIGLALAVGTAEEFIFRVLLLGWLVSKLPAPQALTVSAVVFGLAHVLGHVHHLSELSLLNFVAVIPQTAGGFVLGAVYLRTRNPLGPILAHAFWDFPYFMVLGVGVSGGGTEGGMPSVASLLPWFGFIFYGLWLVRDGVSMTGRVDPIGCTCDSCGVHRRPAMV